MNTNTLATSQLAIRSSRHTIMSNSQLVTSEHITKPPVVKFFYLHAGQVAPRNSAQHGRHSVWSFWFNVCNIEVTGFVLLFEFDVTVS